MERLPQLQAPVELTDRGNDLKLGFRKGSTTNRRHWARTDLPVWGGAGGRRAGASVPLSALCRQRGDLARSCRPCSTLLVPVDRLPQTLNQIKDCKGLGGVEAETDAKHAGCWRGGPEKRRTSQFLSEETHDPPPPLLPSQQGRLWGSPSSCSPSLPLPRQCLLLPNS